MDRALRKYYLLCAVGLCFVALTVVFIIRLNYHFIFVTAFIGVMILYSVVRRIIYLSKAARALEAGKKEVLVHYRDGNMEESKNTIIPVGVDNNWLYGFLTEKKDIKQFRWKGVLWATLDGENIDHDDLLKYIKSIPDKK